MAEQLCSQLRIPANALVLDLCCGTGNAAIAAARRRARVVGLDVDENALDYARFRAETEGVGPVAVVRADAAAMSFPDACFDYVISTQGLVFLPDHEAASRELARVTKPRGVVAFTALTRTSMPSQIYDLVFSVAPDAAAPRYPHYTWSDGERVGRLLSPYFDSVRMRVNNFDSCAQSPQAFYDRLTTTNPPIVRLLKEGTTQVRRAVREGILDILSRCNYATDGSFMACIDYAVVTAVRSS
jgi:ubiquinone/menaquinone biosynthesis C-methylase UbiE